MKNFFTKPLSIAIILGVFIGLLFTFIYIKSGMFLGVGNDMYYYLSLADSLLKNGFLADLTYADPRPVITPQNGLPIIISIFKIFNISNSDILLSLVVIHFFIWCLAVIPFIKLIEASNINSVLTKSILVLGFLAGINILFNQLHPITDGIYNAGSILLVYFLYNKLFVSNEKNNKKNILEWLGISFLSMFLVHFSFRVLIFLFAFLITLFLVKKKDKARGIIFLLFVIVSTFFSLMIFLSFIDSSGITSRAPDFFSSLLVNLLNFKEVVIAYLFSYFEIGRYLVHHSQLVSILEYLILIFFVGTLLYSIHYSFKKNDYLITFIFFVFVLTIVVNLLLPGPEIYLKASPRYMTASLPFFYIMAAKFRWSRYFVFLIIFFSVLTSFSLMVHLKDFNKYQNINVYLREKNMKLPNDAILISSLRRQTYVWLGAGHNNDNFCEIDISNKKRIWILGNTEYQKEKIKEFSNCHDVYVINKLDLSTDYYNNSSPLVEYEFEKIK